MSFKMVDDRKPNKPKEVIDRRRRYGNVRRINNYSKYKQVRPEKVEEIKAVWDSPYFKTNSSRLVYLFRHCKSAEYAYTIREFAHARFPRKMSSGYGEGEAFKALQQMFRRFRHKEELHDIWLNAKFVKSESEGIWRWYYYNMVEDEKGYKEVQLRYARMDLGYDRALARIKEISEMSDEDRRILTERTRDEIMRELAALQEKKKRKGKK